jgi:hypothetical protein
MIGTHLPCRVDRMPLVVVLAAIEICLITFAARLTDVLARLRNTPAPSRVPSW